VRGRQHVELGLSIVRCIQAECVGVYLCFGFVGGLVVCA
jgi:hypothetical protein